MAFILISNKDIPSADLLVDWFFEEKDGIFVLGMVFFSRQVSIFRLAIFDGTLAFSYPPPPAKIQ